jgi:hypothetical protein
MSPFSSFCRDLFRPERKYRGNCGYMPIPFGYRPIGCGQSFVYSSGFGAGRRWAELLAQQARQ